MSALPVFAGCRILVVGDVMLDRYWFGDVHRISPEAPVPVLKVNRVDERPGGAANVARNIAALGAEATLLSVVGNDEAGLCLEKLLGQHGNLTALLHRDPSVSTIIKLRAIAQQQQLLRIDFETPPSHEVLNAALEDYRVQLPLADVVILSDYGKGGLAHIAQMIQMARDAGKPVLVDPKGEDYARYQGATLLTPNRSEFRQVAGGWRDEAELNVKAQSLRANLQLDALLVTRSEDGMSLYRADDVQHEPTHTREVFDVSGAGDTVIATLAVMLAAGADLPDAMRIANRAAGIVVGKLGTAVVSREEIVKDMEG
ncbi:D-glycero-beta-D-manno-heptose-7-phosphate kinase [Gallionella capsiferriformans]|jgi:rfaE bifunctional protein kinase chain/domain|uniref:RfaE bifunctional protein n=1 Tax=Gallionella capsiferriformans (strain ES-2) TaxID=395494 RepID=D9SF82_GALCS|nr:D-glycero-beta-D-manno-heptose-7-phosphate kinase [Gallionella capsiferriformans]ADL55179.1 rfaE bifunctional protein [Gallionella capsiferriformans ES-2]